MLYVCVQTFNVTGNLKIFWKLNMALVKRKTVYMVLATLFIVGFACLAAVKLWNV
jgi:hypothetical protein